ncbi:MAG: pseudouridine synthase [Pseudotabrizicola sp.]|uniref:pseudouridine synthase n=1 Tax=Pseudotabrizicola sp. TaxID=2939647 RepID=UPI0027243B7F|nr:pseudouridine synthase [Pseudotabrizicola sp.]MDO8883648.1 pseudouridine synthase [Pseudotabrizicola sp.]MDP2080734.1 pseudouridine synthase [Pseudotabrizicola sp.]MDZ7574680.1 pseudouridine synthase [Pseudotabrizicola sp.]
MATNEKPPRPKAAPKAAAKTSPEGERIAKVLSRAGISSRREAERLIEAGEVTVNGKLVTSPALNVTAADKITVSGQPVGAPEPARLWLYYKPEGLVTSASDEKGRDTVFDNLPEDMPRVMSIGRLDLNSEGLLLLTNDGALKRQLELPSTGWLRKYRVRVKGNPTEPEIEPLRKGITIDGERFQPMEVKIDRHQGANAWLTIGLREGKNREIRRAMFAIGMTVNRLIRVSYGPFRLNEMEPGDVEEIKARVMRDQLGALISGQIEDASDAQTKPKSRVRTTSRTGSDSDRPARISRSAATKPGEKPARPPRPETAKSPRAAAAKPGARSDTAKPGPRTSTAKSAPPGTISSQRGRKVLGQLSDAWASATKPARRTTTETAEGDTAARPRSRTTTGGKPSTRNARPAAPRGAGPKPPPRRK